MPRPKWYGMWRRFRKGHKFCNTCFARTYLKINVYLSEGTAWHVPSRYFRGSGERRVTLLIQVVPTVSQS